MKQTLSKSRLISAALAKFISGVLIVGLLTFLPAGTFHYPNAWLFMGLLFIPMFCVGIILIFKSPEMLEKRLNAKEKESQQKGLIVWSSLIFIVGFVLSGLNYRFGWFVLPVWVVIAAAVLLIVGYGLWTEVMRENAYLARTVEIQEHQQVIDTGLYGIVRHPMYVAALLLFLSIPLVLGSLVSFVVFLGFIPVFIGRIRNEEKVLEAGLDGYLAYEKKVKYRLLPGIW